jgi:hypothetical protein
MPIGTHTGYIWSVRETRKRSARGDDHDEPIIAIPPTISAEVAGVAARIIARTEAMGLVRFDGARTFDRSALAEAIEALTEAGIGRLAVLERDVAKNLRGALDLLNEAIEHSPHPGTEWRAMSDMLGIELLADLTGISETSARRYESGARETPDEVAERLHFVALVVADLAGSYNPFGVRRWFTRRRKLLDDATPQERLQGAWTADDESARRVASLAQSLTSLGAT